MSSFLIIFSFPKILEKINLCDCYKTRALKFSKIRVARAKMMMSSLNNNVWLPGKNIASILLNIIATHILSCV